jgi:2,3-bisphosphoglycerate-dependent phosphoglycerate mutase
MELLLIRHALPVRIEEADGPADPDLAEAGRHQAAFLAEYLHDERVHAVYASPLRRAVQTAAPLAEDQGVPITLEEGVAEFDRLHSTYIPVEQLKAENHPDWQKLLDGTLADDLGIDSAEWRALVVATLERIITDHAGQKVAVVCHGGVINAYLAHILGVSWSEPGFFYPNYTSIHRVAAARTGERMILTVNETFHLRNTGLPVGLFGSG